ncbi:MAG: IS5/IS1182 family transposase, partial [Nitrospira sp.]|nr:IS5/IS1182 family transposase [Nitrospira sp.]
MTAGHTHDITQAQTLMAGLATQAVVADKAYDADPLIESITQRGAT